MSQRVIALNDDRRRELVELRDNAAKAYMRERAAAILKIGEGIPAAVVAPQAGHRLRLGESL